MYSWVSTDYWRLPGDGRVPDPGPQGHFSYDFNFAGKPEEWTCRNMMSDCVLQGPDSNKRTFVEIFNYEHKLGGRR